MDTLHHYNHSKHNRRVRSALKQKDKVQLKKQLNSISVSCSNRPKSILEYQRKEWGKLNKKCKPRAQKRAALLPREHIEDNPWNEHSWSSSSDTDSDCDSHSDQSRAHSVYSYSRRKQRPFWENDDLKFSYKPPLANMDPATSSMIRTTVRSLMSYQFASYDLKYMRFDMSTFNGQCAYWHYIMDRLGVLDEVFYGHYLSRCDKEESEDSQWYRWKTVDTLLPTVHCLYIFDTVKRAADDRFDRDIASAHPVVQGQAVLVDILYRHNTEGLQLDLCALIGRFVMKKKDISWRYHQRDVADTRMSTTRRRRGGPARECIVESRTLEYTLNGHRVVDRLEPTGIGLIGKVFDGLDITERYQRMLTLYQSNDPMFRPFGVHCSSSWRSIQLMAWSKFKEYYHRQKAGGVEVQWSMVFVILLHLVDGTTRSDLSQFAVKKQHGSGPKKSAQDLCILKEALGATEHDALQQSVWSLFEGAAGGTGSYSKCRWRHDPKQRFREMLVEALAHCETEHDVAYLCSMMMDKEARFMQFDDSMFGVTADDPHGTFREFWKGIWKHLKADWSAQPVYDLMLEHGRRYRHFTAKNGTVWVPTERDEYDWVDVDKFSMNRFLWTDIAPLMVDRYCPDSEHKEMVILIVATKRVKATFDEMVSIIRRVERQQVELSEVDGAMNCEYEAMALVDGRRDKYRRKVESRRKEARRQRMKREYRKWNGKGDERRIQRKMRKYVLRADI